MPPRVTHKDVMGKLCGLCLSKLSLRNMSDTAFGIIKKYVWAGYTKGESPHRLWGSCYTWLTDVSKSGSIEASNRKAPVTAEKLRSLAPPRQTRASASSECQCSVDTAKLVKWKNVPKEDEGTGIRTVPGPIPAPPDTSPTKITLCCFCNGLLAKGVSHVCRRRAK